MSIAQQNEIDALKQRVDRLEEFVRTLLDNRALTSEPRVRLSLPKDPKAK